MQILYFAWLRQKIGVGQEDISPPETVQTVGALLDWLASRGEEFEHALEDRDVIKVAVNQEFASLDAPISEGDEIALFPPVTGG